MDASRRELDLMAKAQNLLRRGLRQSQVTLGAARPRDRAHAGPPTPPAAPTDGGSRVWESPEPPLPLGQSLGALERSFRSWSVNGEPVGHLDNYVTDSFYRFLHTWGLVCDDTGSCLELGANPYFITYLLDEYTKLDLTLANFYGQRGEREERVSYVGPGASSRTEIVRRGVEFNVEQDTFPFETDTFDVVLFCELIEHMTMDPLAALKEIHRVLKPGGVLILTTPNVSRLGNVLAMVNGVNIYDPYSGYGPYGRHNREYNRHELHRLLDFAGYDIESSLTADGNDWDIDNWPWHERITPLVNFRRHDLGQYLFIRGRARQTPREGLPSFLYRSWSDGKIVEFT